MGRYLLGIPGLEGRLAPSVLETAWLGVKDFQPLGPGGSRQDRKWLSPLLSEILPLLGVGSPGLWVGGGLWHQSTGHPCMSEMPRSSWG